MKQISKPVFLDQVLTLAGFALIAAVSSAYVVFRADFAEQNIMFRGIPCPVFIGEILLGGCFLLAGVKALLRDRRYSLKSGHLAWIVFFLWIIARALEGYWSHKELSGFLSFRNAALFYYAGFALMGFVFYPRAGLGRVVTFVGLGLMAVVVRFVPYEEYFWYTLLILYIITAFHLKPRALRWLGWLLIPVFFDFRHFFLDSRSNVVGVFAALAWVVYYFIWIRFRLSARGKLVVLGVIVCCFAGGLYSFADRHGLKSLTSPGELYLVWRQEQDKINAMSRDFVFSPLEVRVFDDNVSRRKRFETAMHEPVPASSREIIPGIVPAGDRGAGKSQPGVDNENRDVVTATLPSEDENAQPQVLPASPDVFEWQMHSKANAQVPDSSIPAAVPVARVTDIKSPPARTYRSLDVAYNNILFRMFIWHDMIVEMINERAVWGISFGKPQRSRSIESLQWAWNEIKETGWITPHNSLLHMVYRGGIVGLVWVMIIFAGVWRLMSCFVRTRDTKGVLLTSVLIYWLALANFLLVLELPYYAIPFWFLFGLIWAYAHRREADAS